MRRTVATMLAAASVVALAGCDDAISVDETPGYWSSRGTVMFTKGFGYLDSGEIRIMSLDGRRQRLQWGGAIPCAPRMGNTIVAAYQRWALRTVPSDGSRQPATFASGSVVQDQLISVAYARNAVRVAYVLYRSGSNTSRLFVTDTSGAAPVLVASDVVNSSVPSFSADGNRIAYYAGVAGNEIHVTDLVSGLTTVVALNARPWTIDQLDFSPADDTILYVGTEAGDDTRQIFAVHASGGLPRSLTANTGIDNRWPAFSADGNRVAFVHGDLLHMMASDGSAEQQLTQPFTSQYRIVLYPEWSPDGSMLLFTAVAANVFSGVLHVVDVATHRMNALETDVARGFWYDGPSTPLFAREHSAEGE